MTTHPSTPTASKRIATIDVMRAIIMLLMLFVNDIPGVDGLPHWLGHAETEEDMLGFSDIVFPGFLFCVGMSIPFAMQSRLRKTAGNVLGVLRHVLDRTVALVVMGLFTLNACKTGLFMLLMTVGFFLVWLNYDKGPAMLKGVPQKVLKGLGIALLFAIMLHYDAIGKPFHTGWWGILGLIGWAAATRCGRKQNRAKSVTLASMMTAKLSSIRLLKSCDIGSILPSSLKPRENLKLSLIACKPKAMRLLSAASRL